MALLADRVKETTTTTGTGTVSLAGAPAGFQSFNAAFTNGSLVYYVIQGGADWEIGIGTVGTGTLARTTVLQSSNADALVPFGVGVKDVFCSYVADRAVTTSDAATLTNKVLDSYTNTVGANHTHFRVKASQTLAKGDVVKATGYNPGQDAIEIAKTTAQTDVALGFVDTAMVSGDFGTVIIIGELENINTNGFAVNDVLYSAGSGGFTATKPASGQYQVIGWVVRANVSTGVVAINVVGPAYVEASTNTANTLVLRDGSGNFSAGTVTAALTGNVSGNASTATTLQTARNINGVSFNGSADITVTAAAGTLTGTTLASNVLASSLTSVGTLANLTVTNPITGSVTGSSGSTTGNAATATALQTARTINGVSFDGTANITVAAAAGTLTGTTLAANVVSSSLTSVGTLGNLTVTNPITGSVTGSSGSTTGNAATATALQTARTINGTSFDGTANITVTANTPNALTAGTYLTSGGTFDGGTARTFAVDATDANTASKVVARDASGNFAAGTITAALSGNASTAAALQTSRNINGVAFNGTADITVTAAAGTLTGTTLNGTVVSSSLTSVGTIGTGVWQGTAISDTYLATISTAGKVSNSATTATSANTASAIVARDASGNFTAGTITATLSGAAPAGSLSGTTLASNVVSSSLTSVGTLTNLTVTNPISGSVTGSSGSTTGNAATATALQTARNINGVSFNGTADITVTAAAGTLSGSTLASGVTASSLTSVGTLSSLAVTGATTLRLDGSGSTTPLILRNDSGTAPIQLVKIGFDSSGVIKSSIVAAVYGDDYMTFNVGTDTERMRLTSTGLGIGTSSPDGRLTVQTSGSTTALNLKAPNNVGQMGFWSTTDSTQKYAIYLASGTAFTLRDTVASVDRLTLDGSGNLGLGVTPSATTAARMFQIGYAGSGVSAFGQTSTVYTQNAYNNAGWKYGGTGQAMLYAMDAGVHAWYTAASGTAGNAISFTQAMTLDASGNLLVGATAAVTSRNELRIGGNASGSVIAMGRSGTNKFFLGVDSSDTVDIQNQANTPMVFHTNNTERARITSGGDVGIGTQSPSQKLDVNGAGAVRARVLSTDGNTSGLLLASQGNTVYALKAGNADNSFRIDQDGNDRLIIASGGNLSVSSVYSATVGGTNRDVYVDNTGLIGYVSSIRASKTNIAPITDTAWLLALNPVSFHYRKKDANGQYTNEADGTLEYGLIAEETETVNPELCFYDIVDGTSELRGISYSKLITPLLKLVQTQQSMIKTLEQRVMALEA